MICLFKNQTDVIRLLKTFICTFLLILSFILCISVKALVGKAFLTASSRLVNLELVSLNFACATGLLAKIRYLLFLTDVETVLLNL